MARRAVTLTSERYLPPVRRPLIGLVLGVLWLSPGTAEAGTYDQVLHLYQARGSIPPCRFTSAQLSGALKGIDTYGQQYFADFSDAVQAALAQRASGACLPGARRATTAALPPLRPGSLTAPTDAGVPAPILALAALGLAIALGFALSAAARGLGSEPPWLARWRHACAEASYRIGGGFDAFADWWRWGR
jgi:hypothetical protein